MRCYINYPTVYLICFIVLFTLSCNQEELTVFDVPYEELKVNYYKLAKNTMEIADEDFISKVVKYEGNELILNNQGGEFNSVKPGTVIVSPLNSKNDVTLFSKVVEVISSGDEVHMKVVPASMIEAYSDYYYDSDNNTTLGFRDNHCYRSLTCFTDFTSSKFTNLLNTAITGLGFDVDVDVKFLLEGEFRGIIKHPHRQYFEETEGGIFNFSGDEEQFTAYVDTLVKNQNSLYDVNGNKIHDDIDEYFKIEMQDTNTQNIIAYLGFVEFQLNNFGVKELSGSVKKGNFAVTDSLNTIFNNLTAPNAENVANTGDIMFTYVPFYIDGIFNFSGSLGPLIKFGMQVETLLKTELKLKERVNIRMGFLNKQNMDASISFIVEDVLTNEEVHMSTIFDNGELNFTGVLKGEIEATVGAVLGLSCGLGSQALGAQANAGFFMSIGPYFNIAGEAGIRALDFMNQTNIQPFGQICFDAGIKVDVGPFVDINLVGTIFDYQKLIPIYHPYQKLQFFTLLEKLANRPDPNIVDGQLKITFTGGCKDIEVEYFNIYVLDDNKKLQFKINNAGFNREKFTIKFNNGTDALVFDNDFKFGEESALTLDQDQADFIMSAIDVDGIVEVHFDAAFNSCIRSILNQEYTYFYCEEDVNFKMLGEDEYVTYDEVQQYDELKRELNDYYNLKNYIETNLSCLPPTGFKIDQEVNPFVNSNFTYLWIQPDEDLNNVLEAYFNIVDDVWEIRPVRLPNSVKALILIVP